MHFLKFIFSFMTLAFPMFAAADTGLGSGGDAPATPTDSGGAPGAAAGSPDGAQPAVQPGQQGIQQLRTAYDGLKAEYEPWKNLGIQPQDVQNFQQFYNRSFQEVASVGRALGYPDDQIIEAMQENPFATLEYLRNEMAEREQGQQPQQNDQDLQERMQQMIEEAVSPIQERENVRLTSEANSVFERTVHQLAVDAYKKEGIDIANVPEDEQFMLVSAASEIMKYDEDNLRDLKYNGNTAGVVRAFNEAKTMLDKYYMARVGRERGGMPMRQAGGGMPPRGPNGQFQNGGAKPTLDQLMENPELINPKYAER